MSTQNIKAALSEKQLQEIAENWIGSDDEFEQSADEDDDESYFDLNTMPIVFEEDGVEINSEGDRTVTEELEEIVDELENNNERYESINYKSTTWKKKNLLLNDDVLEFKGNTALPHTITELETPYQFFSYFFNNQLFDMIKEQSNLYNIQTEPSRPVNLSIEDLKKYVGILIYTSVVHLPGIKTYWSQKVGLQQIKDSMSQKKFQAIKRYLHFNDNTTLGPKDDLNVDRLHKIRPVVDFLNAAFETVPYEQYLCVDEQLCSTKARHYLKQYLPMKPHKWGFKLFVLSGVSGYAYKFEIYTGMENKNRLDNEPDLGCSSNIVVRITRNVPCNQSFRLYFDNYYSSVGLVHYLTSKGVYSLGTIKRNRIPNCQLPTEQRMKKEPRGTSYEYVGNVNGIDISTVIWKDNKLVTLISSFTGKLPVQEVSRYDKKQKKVIKIDCPNLIKEYNRHMGGVDFLDSLIGRYKIQIRTKKWYMRIFYHLIDLTVVNSWILYRKVMVQRKEKYLALAEYRIELADCLCRTGNQNTVKRGRPSNDIETQIQLKKKKGPTTYVPPKDVRIDGIGHWPEHTTNRIRCKKPNCKKLTYVKCSKCGVSLCFNKDNNCFKDFHM